MIKSVGESGSARERDDAQTCLTRESNLVNGRHYPPDLSAYLSQMFSCFFHCAQVRASTEHLDHHIAEKLQHNVKAKEDREEIRAFPETGAASEIPDFDVAVHKDAGGENG